MAKKLTQVGPGAVLGDLGSGCRNIFTNPAEKFARALSDYLQAENVYLLNSGLAAFSVILETLKKLSSKKEVILPAYTAPSMVLPVLKSGLKPVICDISKEDFNIDLDLVPRIVTKDTLCVVPTHLFGIPVKGIERIREKFPGIFIIEDCAQSFGTKINGKNTGCFSDAGFTSFNRGKNLPTYGGGCIFTGSAVLAEKIKYNIKVLKEERLFSKFILPFKMAAFSLAVSPYIYGIFHSVISKFKDNDVPREFSVEKYTGFQAGTGISLLSRFDITAGKRYSNGTALIKGLDGIKGITVPSISKDSNCAFNRLPVLINEPSLRLKARDELWENGIDTSFMYLKPIHHFFDLGYKKEDFPNADYFAASLITLPVHSSVSESEIKIIINVIKKVLQ